MTSSSPQVILWAYPTSPFAQKLQQVLELKQIPYSYCTVSRVPPRPPLQKLGITYRRIPVLAIGADVYFDTALAVIALENKFPDVSLKGRSWAVQTASGLFWSDRTLFPVAAAMIPWSAMPAEFIRDREQYKGQGPIDPKLIESMQPKTLSALRTHMNLIESQLATRTSSSNFILDSPAPIYLDLTLYFVLNWCASFGTADAVFQPKSRDESPFKLTLAWLEQVRLALAKARDTHPQHGKPEKISAEEAVKRVTSASPDSNSTSTDAQEPLLVAGWLKIGDQVEVTPTDVGKVPQRGTLVGLNLERVSIDVTGEGGVKVRVHAPRHGFDVKKVKK